MRTTVVICCALLSVVFCSCQSITKSKTDIVIERMNEAVDPDEIAKDYKTQLSEMELFMPMQGVKANVKVLYKFPDKSKSISVIPNIMKEVTCLNGDKGWAYSNLMGIRDISGKELDFMKFQMSLDRPNVKMQDLFKTIELYEPGQEGGDKDYYKLVCKVKAERGLKPVNIYVDPKTYLVKRVEMFVVNEMGEFPAVSTIKKYDKFGGIYVASEIDIKAMSMLMNMKLKSLKWNVDIKDSEFAKSEKM